jgi:hypothetical protein
MRTSDVAPFIQYRVETVVGEASGWVAAAYIGKRFPLEQCATHFKEPVSLAKCEKR